MKFLPDGPDLPDQLLHAVDAGEAVFFCGSGVSLSKAALPDFQGLLKTVVMNLRVLPNSPVTQILKAESFLSSDAIRYQLPRNRPSLISADRLFGQLEQEFSVDIIETEVAKALAPVRPANLIAHQTILKLASGDHNKPKIVTTNFDLLFEDCNKTSERVWNGPFLPEIEDKNDFSGIVKLHGSVGPSYQSVTNPGLVLSTASFGEAYLANGWATRFVRAILKKYTVIFIGYSADDPPVQYLMEALARMDSASMQAYAFHTELSSSTRWMAKGVKSLQYSKHDGHAALWKTLEKWAIRASDPTSWRKSIVAHSIPGPRQVEPYQRNQVAHLVSTLEGAVSFREGHNGQTPPAEWICVFDPSCRFRKPGPKNTVVGDINQVDPFLLYRLDSDLIPAPINSENSNERRSIPEGAWNAFSWSKTDNESINAQLSAASLHYTQYDGPIPNRIAELFLWLSQVAREPAAIWWAAQQPPLHLNFRRHLRHNLTKPSELGPHQAPSVWSSILDSWDAKVDGERKYHFKEEIKNNGWSPLIARHFEEKSRPTLVLDQSGYRAVIPPDSASGASLKRLVSRRVIYYESLWSIAIPDTQLAIVVAIMRRNLEHAYRLKVEQRSEFMIDIPSIAPSEDRFTSNYGYGSGFGGIFFTYLNRLTRLQEFDPEAFNDEVKFWPTDEYVFAKLRIWLVMDQSRSSSSEAATILSTLDDTTFWRRRGQRDLLISLKNRWNEFDKNQRELLERRIVVGRLYQGRMESDEDFQKDRSWASLDILHWLKNNGCELTLDLKLLTFDLRKFVPNWTPESANTAADAMDPRGGRVETHVQHDEFEHCDLNKIVTKNYELSGRTEDFMIRRNPFTGLSRENPARALAALKNAIATPKEFAKALDSFLAYDVSPNHSVTIIKRTATIICDLNQESFNESIQEITGWLHRMVHREPSPLGKTIVRRLIDRIIIALAANAAGTNIRGNRNDTNWTFLAINSPSGKIAEILMSDVSLPKVANSNGLKHHWKKRAEQILTLGDEDRKLALVTFTRNLPYLFSLDKDWSYNHIIVDENDPGYSAFLHGIIHDGNAYSPELFEVVKPHLRHQLFIHSETDVECGSDFEQSLANIFLGAWLREDISYDNTEFHECLTLSNTAFRTSVLWYCETKMRNDSGIVDDEWLNTVLRLLNDVWPRQTIAQGKEVTRALTDITFSADVRFLDFLQAISPICCSGMDDLSLLDLDEENRIPELYPRQLLGFLDQQISAKGSLHLHWLKSILKRIAAVDIDLKNNSRYQRLWKIV